MMNFERVGKLLSGPGGLVPLIARGEGGPRGGRRVKDRSGTGLLLGLVIFPVASAAASGRGVFRVLRTVDVGWTAAPRWNVPLRLRGILLMGAAVLLELRSYFVFGVLLGGFLWGFVSWAAIERHMGKSGAKSIRIATLAGCAGPICCCGITPLLAGLARAGLPLAAVVAFLIPGSMLNPAAPLPRVSLGDQLDHDRGNPSVGQQQVAVARMLADEVAGNLKPDTSRQIIGLLRELNEKGRTVVMVTYDPLAGQQAKRTVRIVKGAARA